MLLPVSAKEIKVASNNTAYAPEDVQKLASTAVKMGVKEPLNMNVASGASVSAKEIKVASNNTAYAPEDVQKLASTAVKMGVKEPLNMNVASGKMYRNWPIQQ